MMNEATTGQQIRITLVGAGRLGRAVARTWPDRVVAVYDHDVVRAAETVGQTTRAAVLPDVAAVTSVPTDVVWIATTDRAIAEVVDALGAARSDWSGVVVLHSAGLVPLAVLEPLHTAGATIAAFHPNSSIGGDEPLQPDLIWGGAARGADATELARQLLGPSATLLPVEDDRRALYHAAASVAANFTTSLFALAELLYARAGMDPSAARRLATDYMRRAVDRSAAMGPHTAITGPVVRGDWEVVRAQIAAVTAAAPELAAAFESLVVLTDRVFGEDRG